MALVTKRYSCAEILHVVSYSVANRFSVRAYICHLAQIASLPLNDRRRAIDRQAADLFLHSTAAIVAAQWRIRILSTFDTDNMSAELKVALQAASVAADISRSYFKGNFKVTIKEDLTPVTQADVECELAIRKVILDAFPEHGFFGEETGKTAADAENLWLVDPIDGTKGFVRQYPFFSTQIALMRDGELVLGVSNGTMFDELAFAERGQGAWLNGKKLVVSEINRPERAAISTGNLKSLANSDGWSRLGEVVAAADRIRGYGDFYHYHLLAAGKIEAVIESDVNILDIAALAVIVEEAGGTFTDLNGNRPGLATRSVLAANPALHAILLDKLTGFVA